VRLAIAAHQDGSAAELAKRRCVYGGFPQRLEWHRGQCASSDGAIFGLSYVKQIGSSCNQTCQAVLRYVVVTADTGGAAWTTDEGTTRYVLPGVTGCWAVSFSSPDAGWLVGMGGTILKISF